MKMHIIVVGAGFAGLAAAYELSNSGFAVTVLEARQRVGGRVWSTKLSNGAIVEMGGEWISAGEKNIFKLAKRLNLNLVQIGVDFKIRSVVNGAAVSPADQRAATRIATNALATMDETSLARSTIAEFLDNLPLSEPQRAVLWRRLQGSYGADLNEIALRMTGEYSLGENRDYYRFTTGNQSLAEAMAAQLPAVRLGHAVSTITYYQTGVSIKGKKPTDAFEIEADAVILAVPVKILTELVFDPALPQAVAEAIASVPMGVAAKLMVGTQKPPPLRAIQDVEMPYWGWTGNGEKGSPRSAATAFCGSTEAQQNLATNSHDPSIWFSKLRSAMPEVDFLNDPNMVDWSQDEWTGGCYSAFDNKATDLIPLLTQPVGRIFFAGEHTAEESATMEGALTSGFRAARQVIEVFR